MVNSKNPNKLIKNPTLPPGIQDSSQCVGESPDSLNLLSRTSSRAGKRVHSRRRPQTRRIARRSSRSVSASSASRNPSPEALSSSSSGESEEESVGSDPKMPTIPRVITGKLSFKKLPSLKLPAAFPEGKAPTMSHRIEFWDCPSNAEWSLHQMVHNDVTNTRVAAGHHPAISLDTLRSKSVLSCLDAWRTAFNRPTV